MNNASASVVALATQNSHHHLATTSILHTIPPPRYTSYNRPCTPPQHQQPYAQILSLPLPVPSRLKHKPRPLLSFLRPSCRTLSRILKGAIGFLLGVLGLIATYQALRLAMWSAVKEFREDCRAGAQAQVQAKDHTQNFQLPPSQSSSPAAPPLPLPSGSTLPASSLSPGCIQALSHPLSPPPVWLWDSFYDEVAREGIRKQGDAAIMYGGMGTCERPSPVCRKLNWHSMISYYGSACHGKLPISHVQALWEMCLGLEPTWTQKRIGMWTSQVDIGFEMAKSKDLPMEILWVPNDDGAGWRVQNGMDLYPTRARGWRDETAGLSNARLQHHCVVSLTCLALGWWWIVERKSKR